MSNEQEHIEEHASLIKTPKQLIVTVVLAFVIPITIILLLVNMISIGTKDARGSDALSPEAVAKRIAPVAGFELVEGEAPQAQAPAQPAAPAPAPVAAAPAAQQPQQPQQPAAAQQAAVNPAGEKLYKTACFACHGTGAAGAPKFGDKAAWAPHLEHGIDAMVENAIKGKGAMPPKGGAMNASDADIRAAVEYMVNAVK